MDTPRGDNQAKVFGLRRLKLVLIDINLKSYLLQPLNHFVYISVVFFSTSRVDQDVIKVGGIDPIEEVL